MDLYKTIRDLYEEKKRLDDLIASLEGMLLSDRQGTVSKPRRRGRKAMSPEERQAVSDRMRKYWAGRKKDDMPGDNLESTGS